MSDQPLPLSGLRVVDCTVDRGELASRLLGDLGADVVKVEPPAGRPGAGLRAGTAGRVVGVRGPQRGQARRRARPGRRRPTSSASTSCSTTPTCSSPPARTWRRASTRATWPPVTRTSWSARSRRSASTVPYADWAATDATLAASGGFAFKAGVPEDSPLLPARAPGRRRGVDHQRVRPPVRAVPA